MTETTGDTLRDLVGAYLAEQCTVIVDAEPALRGGENVVHVTRVGGPPAAQHDPGVRRAVRRRAGRSPGGRAGLVGGSARRRSATWTSCRRALTEQIAALPPELVLGPVESTIQTEIATRRKVGMDVVVEAMDSERYRKLVALVHAWRSDPPFTAAADAPAARSRATSSGPSKKVTKRLAAAVAAREAGEDEADELFHSARKAGKRHRYAVEATVPLWGSQGREGRGGPQGPAGRPRRTTRTGRSAPRSCATSAPGSAYAPASQRLHLRPALRPGGRRRRHPGRRPRAVSSGPCVLALRRSDPHVRTYLPRETAHFTHRSFADPVRASHRILRINGAPDRRLGSQAPARSATAEWAPHDVAEEAAARWPEPPPHPRTTSPSGSSTSTSPRRCRPASWSTRTRSSTPAPCRTPATA